MGSLVLLSQHLLDAVPPRNTNKRGECGLGRRKLVADGLDVPVQICRGLGRCVPIRQTQTIMLLWKIAQSRVPMPKMMHFACGPAISKEDVVWWGVLVMTCRGPGRCAPTLTTQIMLLLLVVAQSHVAQVPVLTMRAPSMMILLSRPETMQAPRRWCDHCGSFLIRSMCALA